MNNKEMLDYAETLRKQADRLEAKANRNLPEKWEVGHVVRFIEDKEWCCSKGCIAEITGIKEGYDVSAADEYQVLYTSPMNGTGSWWTTPDEIEWVET